MKHLFIAIALMAVSFTAAFAGNGLTKQENDANITVGHSKIAAKVAMLESNLTANNLTAADVTAKEILTLMRTGMVQGKARVSLESAEKRAAANKEFLGMEMATYEYAKLSTDVSANGTKMVAKVHEYLKNY